MFLTNFDDFGQIGISYLSYKKISIITRNTLGLDVIYVLLRDRKSTVLNILVQSFIVSAWVCQLSKFLLHYKISSLQKQNIFRVLECKKIFHDSQNHALKKKLYIPKYSELFTSHLSIIETWHSNLMRSE